MEVASLVFQTKVHGIETKLGCNRLLVLIINNLHVILYILFQLSQLRFS
jgi:hypothetical protein